MWIIVQKNSWSLLNLLCISFFDKKIYNQKYFDDIIKCTQNLNVAWGYTPSRKPLPGFPAKLNKFFIQGHI